jgi:hypothetical protein
MNKPIEATLLGGLACLAIVLFALLCVFIENGWKWLKK